MHFLPPCGAPLCSRPHHPQTFCALLHHPPPCQTGGLPPLEGVPGLEKGSGNPLDTVVKLLKGLSQNEDFKEMVTTTIPNNIREALSTRRDEDEYET